MEIDFNPARIPKPDSGQSVTRRSATPIASDSTSISTTASLGSNLNDTPFVRPEKVDMAKGLVSDTQYPPDYVLDRIAVLLAARLKS
jgi:hypothetical protein